MSPLADDHQRVVEARCELYRKVEAVRQLEKDIITVSPAHMENLLQLVRDSVTSVSKLVTFLHTVCSEDTDKVQEELKTTVDSSSSQSATDPSNISTSIKSKSFEEINFFETPKNISKRRKKKKKGKPFDDSFEKSLDAILADKENIENSSLKSVDSDEVITDVSNQSLNFRPFVMDSPGEPAPSWRESGAERMQEEDLVQRGDLSGQLDLVYDVKRDLQEIHDLERRDLQALERRDLSQQLDLEAEIPATPCIPKQTRKTFMIKDTAFGAIQTNDDSLDSSMQVNSTEVETPKQCDEVDRAGVRDYVKTVAFPYSPVSPILPSQAQQQRQAENRFEQMNLDLPRTCFDNLSIQCEPAADSPPHEARRAEASPGLVSILAQAGRRSGQARKRVAICGKSEYFYFARCQGWASVPKEGGNTLGMLATHFHTEQQPTNDCEADNTKLDNADGALINQSYETGEEWRSSFQEPGVLRFTKMSEQPQAGAAPAVAKTIRKGKSKKKFRVAAVSAVEDAVEPGRPAAHQTGELGTRGLERVSARKRRNMLKQEEVELDSREAEELNQLRQSRDAVGCGCGPGAGACSGQSGGGITKRCSCAGAGISCHQEREGEPCSCEPDCGNPEGRYCFDQTATSLHWVQTMLQTKGAFQLG